MIQIFKMAYRDLGRNRRRSFFSALAVGIGLGLLILMASFVGGEMDNAINTAIRLQSGHIQLRAASYDENKSSLKWKDLVENPDQVASQVAALDQVKVATPRLYASGFLSTGDESTGVRIIGIDPVSAANDPYREGVISGSYLTADDREGLLLGKPAAEKLHLTAGDKVSLSVNTANGNVDEQKFIIRGIYSTGTYGFDNSTIFMPILKTQALTQTENHASTIFILLKDTSYTDRVTAQLKDTGLDIMTWRDLNPLVIDFETMSQSYMALFYMIVLAITASVIINTLIMSVYERTREIGILSAIGMKGRRIMGLFLAESALLAVGGVIMGLIIGILATIYFNNVGFDISKMGLTGFLVTDKLYTKLTMNDVVSLSIITFVITVVAGLYPAVMASRLEPVEALRAEK
jgi:ABC-type lipoprotein release transport system permease subunit